MLFYLYIPCPGSSGTSFTSNLNGSTNLSGDYIIFSDLYPGECYSVSLLNVLPTPSNPDPEPDVIINWDTEAYSTYISCTDCIESQEILYPCLCSRATNLTSNPITFQYISCNGKGNNYTTLQPGETGPKICVREWLGTHPEGTFDYFGDCVDEECPPVYLLTDCSNPENTFCTNTNLSAFANNGSSVILVGEAYANTCWTVNLAENCENPVSVIVQYYYKNCQNCLEQFVQNYKLLNCEDQSVIYTTTDLSQYVNSVITLEEYADSCWFVEVIDSPIPGDITVTPVLTYNNCQDCTTPQYLLEDCNVENPEPNIITNVDLSAYVGQVVTLLNCPDICWTVSESPEIITNPQLVHVTASHIDCEECIQPAPEPVRPVYKFKSITPGYDTPGCSPEKFEKIVCNFSEAMYRQIMVDAYGITPCCGEDDIKYEIKYELIKLKAIQDPDYNCLKSPSCECTTSTYGLTPCEPTVCHNYVISVRSLNGTTFVYNNCNNVSTTINIPASNEINTYTICTAAGQTFTSPIGAEVFDVVETTIVCISS
jgi:hypothetical protein